MELHRIASPANWQMAVFAAQELET